MISRNKFNEYINHKQYDCIQQHKVTNAIILAAGKSKRFKPISDYCPKGLSIVKGEVLVERQIKQLQAVGISDITLVVGYKKEMFFYLADKYNVKIVVNEQYDTQDNVSSLRLVLDQLDNTYICSVDNYYPENLFNTYEYRGFYSTIYVENNSDEWVVRTDEAGLINDVNIGAPSGHIMLGFVYFDREFSENFRRVIHDVEGIDEYNHHVWEYLYMKYLDTLKLEIKEFDTNSILEFDTIDDAINFDESFLRNNTNDKFD
ncbi:NTP transferase domain-containing protein [uncultured Veillonella sp.]|jgi:transcriptional regulator, MarR family|uniref:NTP transferase domain-containing protein n=1 Tax=uncultured Veillonella sp. TaxID=159268 RepID=UPI00288906F5|nr:NTP transferase domain-containing protein [uncultured Veillonella sp.]